jgi:hypothetical protein
VPRPPRLTQPRLTLLLAAGALAVATLTAASPMLDAIRLDVSRPPPPPART